MLQQPLPIPQTMPPVPSIPQHPQAHWPQAITGPYTAAMQMERQQQVQANQVAQAQAAQAAQAATGQPNNRVPFAPGGEMPPPLPGSAAPYSSPTRGGGMVNPTLHDLSNYNATGSALNPQAQQRQFFDLQQQQQQHQAQQQQQQQALRGHFYYPPQMQYNMHPGFPGGIPTPDPQFQPPQAYHPMFQPQNVPYGAYNPYQPALYGPREPWQQLDGDTSYPNAMSHHPQHSSAHGNAESFRYIRQINNNDVLCGRGGATNSHIGNRAFRQFVKEYKDKYLRAKKKEKPSVAGEIVDKIRSLDPPGRFLKKDRDTGYWLDIGDIRAKEKTSQALREGAPLIRRQMKENNSLYDDEGGTEFVNQDLAMNIGAQTEKEGVDGKRKSLSLVPQLPEMDVKVDYDQAEASSPPLPKRMKCEEAVESVADEKNDNDNVSKLPGAESGPNSNIRSETTTTSDVNIEDISKGEEIAKVNDKNITQDEYTDAFDPPRALKQDVETKVEGKEGKSEETIHFV